MTITSNTPPSSSAGEREGTWSVTCNHPSGQGEGTPDPPYHK